MIGNRNSSERKKELKYVAKLTQLWPVMVQKKLLWYLKCLPAKKFTVLNSFKNKAVKKNHTNY